MSNVIVHARTGLRHAGLALTVRGGPRYEPARLAGSTHLLEHCLFGGTPSWPSSGAIASHVDALGLDLNGETHRDVMSITCKFVPELWREAVDLTTEMLLYPLLDAATMRKERRVVTTEVCGDLNEHHHTLSAEEIASWYMWPGHPLAQPVGGYSSSVARASRKRLLAFHQAIVTRDNLVSAIVGDIPTDEALQYLTAKLVGMRSATALPTTTPTLATDVPVLMQHSQDALITLSLQWGVPGSKSPEHAAFALLPHALTRSFSTPLRRALVEDSGLIYDLHSRVDDYGDVARMVIEMEVEPKKLQRALDVTLRTLDTATPDVTRARRAYLRDIVWDDEDAVHAACTHTTAVLLGVPHTPDVARVSDTDLRQAVDALSTPVVVLVGPCARVHSRACESALGLRTDSAIENAGAFIATL